MHLPAHGQLLIDRIRNRTARIGVVGLGYVGLPTAAGGRQGVHRAHRVIEST